MSAVASAPTIRHCERRMVLGDVTDAGARGSWTAFAHIDFFGNGGATLRVEPGLLTVEIGAALGLFKGLKRLEKREGEVLVSS